MPKKIDWSEKLSTEILSLDGQHAELIHLFNDFIDAVEAEKGPNEICARFKEILDETQTHFAYEEQIMRNIGFPGYTTHKSHHDNLCRDALEVYKELENGKYNDDIMPSIVFLRALVIKHMVEQDLKIREYVTHGTSEE